MSKMQWQIQSFKSMNVLGVALVAAMAWSAAAHAADCPRKGTLGTARILRVDAATTPRVGLKSFPQTLPLGDHEVVLTFDDGPWSRSGCFAPKAAFPADQLFDPERTQDRLAREHLGICVNHAPNAGNSRAEPIARLNQRADAGEISIR
jgi:hypothetical protein